MCISSLDNHTLRHNPPQLREILSRDSAPLEIKHVGLQSDGISFPELNSLREIRMNALEMRLVPTVLRYDKNICYLTMNISDRVEWKAIVWREVTVT